MSYPKVPIGELVSLRQGFAINKNTKHHISDAPTALPLLRIADMKDKVQNVFVKDTIPAHFIAKPEDIIYTRTGQVGLVFTDQYGVIHNNCFTVTPNDAETLNRYYLYYVLQSEDFYSAANNLASGAAQPDLPHGAFRSIEIPIPPLASQIRIAEILKGYDDLIDNNQKQIKLLEEAAQRMYKEWFVDLRFPGYENTPITEGIPEGWSQGVLGDVVVESGRKITKDNREGYSYYLPIDCLPKKSLGYITTNEIALAESSLVAFVPRDIIFGAMRPYFHKVVVARDSGITRTTCFVLNTGNPAYWAYAVMLMFSSDTVDYATQISVGTTMDYYDRYQTIIKEYNEEKNRAEIERIFDELTKLANDLTQEEKRYVREGFSSDEELSMFDLLFKADLSKQEITKIKKVAVDLLAKVKNKIAELDHWADKPETKAIVDNLIRDTLWAELPESYDEISITTYRKEIYEYIYLRYQSAA